MSIAKVIARAWRDPAYKAKLLSDPHAALAEAGVEVSAETKLNVLEDTDDITHLVLPAAPNKTSALSNDELEKIAGGDMIDPEFGLRGAKH